MSTSTRSTRQSQRYGAVEFAVPAPRPFRGRKKVSTSQPSDSENLTVKENVSLTENKNKEESLIPESDQKMQQLEQEEDTRGRRKRTRVAKRDEDVEKILLEDTVVGKTRKVYAGGGVDRSSDEYKRWIDPSVQVGMKMKIPRPMPANAYWNAPISDVFKRLTEVCKHFAVNEGLVAEKTNINRGVFSRMKKGTYPHVTQDLYEALIRCEAYTLDLEVLRELCQKAKELGYDRNRVCVALGLDRRLFDRWFSFECPLSDRRPMELRMYILFGMEDPELRFRSTKRTRAGKARSRNHPQTKKKKIIYSSSSSSESDSESEESEEFSEEVIIEDQGDGKLLFPNSRQGKSRRHSSKLSLTMNPSQLPIPDLDILGETQLPNLPNHFPSPPSSAPEPFVFRPLASPSSNVNFKNVEMQVHFPVGPSPLLHLHQTPTKFTPAFLARPNSIPLFDLPAPSPATHGLFASPLSLGIHSFGSFAISPERK